MGKTKRLFYTPGLISLIGLLFAWPLFYNKNYPVKEYCLSLYQPKDNYDKNSFDYFFSTYKLEKDIFKKKKIKFALNDNINENRRKMEMIRYEALKL